MFPFKADYSARQKNITKGKNTCEYIILHHTGTWEGTLQGNVKTLLWETDRQVSCHFLVDTNWDAYKLGNPDMILWHAGESEWQGKKWLNSYSMWIEVIWPLANWGFTEEQKKTVFWLVQHLMNVCNIPKEKVIRHKDIAPWRKTDIADTFWNTKYKTYAEWQNTLKPRIF